MKKSKGFSCALCSMDRAQKNAALRVGGVSIYWLGRKRRRLGCCGDTDALDHERTKV
jgi:hypothetical protein